MSAVLRLAAAVAVGAAAGYVLGRRGEPGHVLPLTDAEVEQLFGAAFDGSRERPRA